MKRSLLLLLVCLMAILADAKTYVVSVGISRYQYIGALNLPAKDAKAVQELYAKNGADVLLLTDEKATKANILSSLNTHFAKADANDQIVLFFSGHGYPGGICSYDIVDESSGLSYSELKSVFKQSCAKRKIIMANTCFSGKLRSSNQVGKASHKEHNDEDTNVILFLSSRSNEASLEIPFLANSLFATYLLRGLKGGADINRDRCISAKEIFNYVSEGVKQKSKDSQHPVMWGSFDDNFVMMDWR